MTLIEKIDMAINGNEYSNDMHTRILKHREKGAITHLELVNIFKKKWSRTIQNQLTKWMSGTLFWNQTCDFDSWLHTDMEIMREDDKNWSDLAATLSAIDEPWPISFGVFHTRIVYPGIGQRQKIFEDNRILESLRLRWIKENEIYHWDWRKQ